MSTNAQIYSPMHFAIRFKAFKMKYDNPGTYGQCQQSSSKSNKFQALGVQFINHSEDCVALW